MTSFFNLMIELFLFGIVLAAPESIQHKKTIQINYLEYINDKHSNERMCLALIVLLKVLRKLDVDSCAHQVHHPESTF